MGRGGPQPACQVRPGDLQQEGAMADLEDPEANPFGYALGENLVPHLLSNEIIYNEDDHEDDGNKDDGSEENEDKVPPKDDDVEERKCPWNTNNNARETYSPLGSTLSSPHSEILGTTMVAPRRSTLRWQVAHNDGSGNLLPQQTSVYRHEHADVAKMDRPARLNTVVDDALSKAECSLHNSVSGGDGLSDLDSGFSRRIVDLASECKVMPAVFMQSTKPGDIVSTRASNPTDLVNESCNNKYSENSGRSRKEKYDDEREQASGDGSSSKEEEESNPRTREEAEGVRGGQKEMTNSVGSQITGERRNEDLQTMKKDPLVKDDGVFSSTREYSFQHIESTKIREISRGFSHASGSYQPHGSFVIGGNAFEMPDDPSGAVTRFRDARNDSEAEDDVSWTKSAEIDLLEFANLAECEDDTRVDNITLTSDASHEDIDRTTVADFVSGCSIGDGTVWKGLESSPRVERPKARRAKSIKTQQGRGKMSSVDGKPYDSSSLTEDEADTCEFEIPEMGRYKWGPDLRLIEGSSVDRDSCVERTQDTENMHHSNFSMAPVLETEERSGKECSSKQQDGSPKAGFNLPTAFTASSEFDIGTFFLQRQNLGEFDLQKHIKSGRDSHAALHAAGAFEAHSEYAIERSHPSAFEIPRDSFRKRIHKSNDNATHVTGPCGIAAAPTVLDMSRVSGGTTCIEVVSASVNACTDSRVTIASLSPLSSRWEAELVSHSAQADSSSLDKALNPDTPLASREIQCRETLETCKKLTLCHDGVPGDEPRQAQNLVPINERYRQADAPRMYEREKTVQFIDYCERHGIRVQSDDTSRALYSSKPHGSSETSNDPTLVNISSLQTSQQTLPVEERKPQSVAESSCMSHTQAEFSSESDSCRRNMSSKCVQFLVPEVQEWHDDTSTGPVQGPHAVFSDSAENNATASDLTMSSSLASLTSGSAQVPNSIVRQPMRLKSCMKKKAKYSASTGNTTPTKPLNRQKARVYNRSTSLSNCISSREASRTGVQRQNVSLKNIYHRRPVRGLGRQGSSERMTSRYPKANVVSTTPAANSSRTSQKFQVCKTSPCDDISVLPTDAMLQSISTDCVVCKSVSVGQSAASHIYLTQDIEAMMPTTNVQTESCKTTGTSQRFSASKSAISMAAQVTQGLADDRTSLDFVTMVCDSVQNTLRSEGSHKDQQSCDDLCNLETIREGNLSQSDEFDSSSSIMQELSLEVQSNVFARPVMPSPRPSSHDQALIDGHARADTVHVHDDLCVQQQRVRWEDRIKAPEVCIGDIRERPNHVGQIHEIDRPTTDQCVYSSESIALRHVNEDPALAQYYECRGDNEPTREDDAFSDYMFGEVYQSNDDSALPPEPIKDNVFDGLVSCQRLDTPGSGEDPRPSKNAHEQAPASGTVADNRPAPGIFDLNITPGSGARPRTYTTTKSPKVSERKSMNTHISPALEDTTGLNAISDILHQSVRDTTQLLGIQRRVCIQDLESQARRQVHHDLMLQGQSRDDACLQLQDRRADGSSRRPKLQRQNAFSGHEDLCVNVHNELSASIQANEPSVSILPSEASALVRNTIDDIGILTSLDGEESIDREPPCPAGSSVPNPDEFQWPSDVQKYMATSRKNDRGPLTREAEGGLDSHLSYGGGGDNELFLRDVIENPAKVFSSEHIGPHREAVAYVAGNGPEENASVAGSKPKDTLDNAYKQNEGDPEGQGFLHEDGVPENKDQTLAKDKPVPDKDLQGLVSDRQESGFKKRASGSDKRGSDKDGKIPEEEKRKSVRGSFQKSISKAEAEGAAETDTETEAGGDKPKRQKSQGGRRSMAGGAPDGGGKKGMGWCKLRRPKFGMDKLFPVKIIAESHYLPSTNVISVVVKPINVVVDKDKLNIMVQVHRHSKTTEHRVSTAGTTLPTIEVPETTTKRVVFKRDPVATMMPRMLTRNIVDLRALNAPFNTAMNPEVSSRYERLYGRWKDL